MSQASSADVAQAAFSLGAMGYVVKAHAGSELLAAVEAVCKGRYFVSKGLSEPQLDLPLPVHKLPAPSSTRKFPHRLRLIGQRSNTATRFSSIPMIRLFYLASLVSSKLL